MAPIVRNTIQTRDDVLTDTVFHGRKTRILESFESEKRILGYHNTDGRIAAELEKTIHGSDLFGHLAVTEFLAFPVGKEEENILFGHPLRRRRGYLPFIPELVDLARLAFISAIYDRPCMLGINSAHYLHVLIGEFHIGISGHE